MKHAYCRNCVYPAVAVNLVLNDDGVCSACQVYQGDTQELDEAFWEARKVQFHALLDRYRRSSGEYDCVVPVGGGKDSYYQAHVMKQAGMNPLLVTYHGNNYLPEGQANLDRMREKLNLDHVVFGPSVETLRRLNRLCFKKMGDMNWHAHAGIKIVPVRFAVKFNIPLVVWGEVFWDIAGMFSSEDLVEYNKRSVIEHDLRGYTWEDMVGPQGFEGEESLEAKDLAWLRFPTDEELLQTGCRGIFIGNYFRWNPNEHAQQMRERYGFEFARQPFERTYRTMSNLDDMHENGIHDYMKFVKFGYGRASDHASKDIRSGHMTREQGVAMVQRYDHAKPRRDLERWLAYVDMSEDEFDRIADGFRNPRVWWIEDGKWWKYDITGEPGEYGPVHLTDPAQLARYQRSLPVAAGDQVLSSSSNS